MSIDRFAPQATQQEGEYSKQTFGLVSASDLRKRRAEVADHLNQNAGSHDTSRTPSEVATASERESTPQLQVKKKRKTGKGKLSFAIDGDEDEDERKVKPPQKKDKSLAKPQKSQVSADGVDSEPVELQASSSGYEEKPFVKQRLGPNAAIGNGPKIMTKSALQKEANEREKLRQEFINMQEEVRSTEIMIPFVFHDGTNIPGGACRVKKGDPIWLFLDKCRKLGAELAVGATNQAKSRREWARVGVDDLMLVRGDIIIPHHYDFYYFIVNKTLGYDSTPLFPFSSKPSEAAKTKQAAIETGTYNPISRPSDRKLEESNLEGHDEDPNSTKVINRQWYERNKHIFPASTWEEFDPSKDYTAAARRDTQGNSYFFSQ